MLTRAQLDTLKADILAATDQAVIDARTLRDDVALAALYNAAASPEYWVWRSRLTPEEARSAIIAGDGLAQLDNLTAGKRESLLWALSGNTDPGSATQRAAIENLCGSQNALKAAVSAAQKRVVTRAERLFTSGAGSAASPATLGWEGTVTHMDISDTLNG